MPETKVDAICPKCKEKSLVKTTFESNLPSVEECTNCGYKKR